MDGRMRRLLSCEVSARSNNLSASWLSLAGGMSRSPDTSISRPRLRLPGIQSDDFVFTALASTTICVRIVLLDLLMGCG